MSTPAQRYHAWRSRNRKAVVKRGDHKCELCGYWANDVDHAFQRHNIVAEPLASHPAFLTLLCAMCHRDATNNPKGETRWLVRQKALWRAQEQWPQLAVWGLCNDEVGEDEEGYQVGRARAVETELRSTGLWRVLECRAIERAS